VSARVVRVWKGSGSADGVDRYCREHFSTAVLPMLRTMDGFVDARVLVRPIDHRVEVVVATVWDSIDAIRRFAGPDYERAVVEPIVRDILERYDDRVTHFTVAVDPGDAAITDRAATDEHGTTSASQQ
jgi:heme-degrading monooxygenase HmoA